MRSLIYTVASGLTTVASTALSLGNIVRRYGCAVNKTAGDTIIISKPGYYEIGFDAVLTNGTTASLTPEIDIQQNGTTVTGGFALTTLAAAETDTIGASCIVRTYCNANSAIQIVPTVAGVTVSNLSVTVKEV